MEPVEDIEDAPEEVTEVDPYLDQALLVAMDFINGEELAANN